MKKSKKVALGTSILAGLLAGLLFKSKATKAIGFGVAGIGAGFLLKEIYGEEKKKVNEQCKETEKIIEESGLDITKVDEIDLLVPKNTTNDIDGEDEIIFGETLLSHSYNNNVFSDEMLKYDSKDILHTLHVLQNVEKNRIMISIPLPRQNKKGIGPSDMRQHFENIFEDFIEEKGLDMQMFTNQIGVHVGESLNDGYIYYTELERESPDENFNSYLKRINTIMNAWDRGDREAHAKWDVIEDGNDHLKTLRFEQYLILEFPVFPTSSHKTGLNLLSAMCLLKKLTEVMTISSSSTGRDHEFEFNHIVFHPGDDYGTILQIEAGKIKSIDL
jgi:hypothetical protein